MLVPLPGLTASAVTHHSTTLWLAWGHSQPQWQPPPRTRALLSPSSAISGLGDRAPLLTALVSSSTTESCSLQSTQRWETQKALDWGRRRGAVTTGSNAHRGQSMGQQKLHLLTLLMPIPSAPASKRDSLEASGREDPNVEAGKHHRCWKHHGILCSQHPSSPSPSLQAAGGREHQVPLASSCAVPLTSTGQGRPALGQRLSAGLLPAAEANMTQRRAATSCSSHCSSEVTSASARAGRQDMLCMPAALLPDTAWLQQTPWPVFLTSYGLSTN